MREQGSSPREGERLRPLTRGQVEDRLQELGDLYAEVSGGGPWAWNEARAAFLQYLAADARRPGFSLLIAETTVLTGCAYGFPVGGAGPWWAGFDGDVRESLLRRVAPGGSSSSPGSSSRPACAGRTRAVPGTSPGACSGDCSPTTAPRSESRWWKPGTSGWLRR